MRKLISFTLLFALISSLGFSQEKKLTLEDAIFPDQLMGIQPYGANNFTYVKNYTEIFHINSLGIMPESIVKLEDINTALKEAGLNEINYFPFWDYSWADEGQLLFNMNGNAFVYNIKSKTFGSKFILPQGAEHISLFNENNFAVYTVKNNLFYIDKDNKSIQITNDENLGIVSGNSYTHRQEFGIDNGIFKSPKGNYIAFYRKDETMVTDYPLVDITTRIANLKNTKYPMIGEKSEEVTLGIYNLETEKTVFADVSDFTNERYLTSITWDPDEKYVYIGVLNRGQDHLKLNKYDAKTGKFIKTLFEEKNSRYVEPEHPMIFIEGLKDQFIWYSERDGYNHLYLYDTDGKMLRQLTSGKWTVQDFLGFDKQNKFFFIMSTKESPIESHFYKINFSNGKEYKLTSESGNHIVVLSNTKEFFLDSYSNTEIPSISRIVNTDGKYEKELIKADDPFKSYKLGKMKIGTLKAADGKTDLYYRLITPPNFDPNKKYPVVVYVYGGPHAQLVNNSWLGGASLWSYYMAQEGYVMFTLDNRGSANRGFEFESIIHRQCGQEEMKDQMQGIKFLKSLSYVDENRIGLHGWSYGGFMTTSLMVNYPEIFKVGVAGGPVIDWKYYEVMYGERYMDTPIENPDGFKKTSLLDKAEKLKGRLMIVHGYQDPVVVPQNSIDFIRSCIKAGTDIDFFVYPESEHNMRGQTRVHLMKKVTRYFDDYLK